jgi:hypothetical protein
MRPKSITLFEIFAWIAVGAGALLFVIDMASAGLGGSSGIIVLIGLLIVIGLGVCTFLAAHMQSSAAKWIFLIGGILLGLFCLLGLIGMLSSGRRFNPLSLLLVLVTLGALITALVFLLQRDASAWFAQKAQSQGHGGGYNPAGGYPSGGGYPPAPAFPAPAAGNWGAPPAPHSGGGYAPAPEPIQAAVPPQPAPAPWGAPAAALPSTGYPPAPSQVSADGTRACPFCAEDIKAQAVKCRFCGSDVEPLVR